MRARNITHLLGSLLALASCRSILDIHEGTLDTSDGSGGSSTSGASATQAQGGSDAMPDGGDGSVVPQGGKAGGSSSGGKAGSGSQGGSLAEAGAPVAEAGSDAGGVGNQPDPLFPAGSCRDCIDRNCAAQVAPCVDDSNCVVGVDDWLACTNVDAALCVPDGADELVACAAQSCDLCRTLDDGTPSVEILTPANGAQITLDDTGLIEVTVRVHNYRVKQLGTCGADPDCGHVHLNLAGDTCKVNAFFNSWWPSADANGVVEGTVSTKANAACEAAVRGQTVLLSASLSAATAHQDRLPLIQSSVSVSIAE